MFDYACGEVLVALGVTTGGQGFPPGVIPGLVGTVPPALPVPGAEGAVDEPGVGLVPGVPLAPGVLGKVPHGEPVGEPFGLFGVFGLMVDG
jgi:hypothetical protein